MKKALIVVDYQNDFVDGALGFLAAENVADKIYTLVAKAMADKDFIVFTKDTHYDNYMETREGKFLPVPHCIKGSEGWMIRPELDVLRKTPAIDKVTFGSSFLPEKLLSMNAVDPIESITFVGLCTDICVISNVMIAKAFLPEVPVIVDAACCAGVSPETHKNALEAMKVCQVKVENE